jgi:ArsR family transcriptional regulator
MAVDVGVDVKHVLKALAEPLRWRIVERLADEELCVCHLVDDLGVAQPLVSHHLRALRSAGLVESERHRQWVYYRLRPGALTALAQAVAGLAAGEGAGPVRRRPCS